MINDNWRFKVDGRIEDLFGSKEVGSAKYPETLISNSPAAPIFIDKDRPDVIFTNIFSN